jgi:hypothetical protein
VYFVFWPGQLVLLGKLNVEGIYTEFWWETSWKWPTGRWECSMIADVGETEFWNREDETDSDM